MSSMSATAKNAALDALDIATASLHSAFPGATGANELSGGSYARKSIVVNAASGGVRLLNAAVIFDVPASTVRWIQYWDTPGNPLFCVPNGGYTPKNFMSLASTDVVYAASHGYAENDTIVFYSGTPPAPLVEGTTYYVKDATTDSFKVAATAGGTAINLTAPPSYNVSVCRIEEQTYPTADTHALATATFTIPD